MSEFENPTGREPTPESARTPTPVPHAAVPTGTHQQDAPRPVRSKAWMGVTSLSVGVAGWILMLTALLSAGMGVMIAVPLLGIPTSIVAIVFGHLGFNDARKNNTPRGISIVGILAGYLLLIALIVMVVFMVLFAAALVNWSIDG